MTVATQWVRYGQDQRYLGYIARPEGVNGSIPAVIVIQEIWGVDDHIEDVARRFAQAGYVALAPDLYAENGTRPEALAHQRVAQVKEFLQTVPRTAWNNPEEREAAIERLPEPDRTQVRSSFATLFGGLKMDNYQGQLLATAAFLREECAYSCGRKVGSVGFCMGGALSAALACQDADLGAAVIFYGNRPTAEQIGGIQCPVMGFYGGLDARITDAVPGLASDMAGAGKRFAYQVYEGAHHAFFNDTRAAYDAEAARDAFARTLTFFNEHLS